jgi:alanyl-tRNA synthetase
VLKEILNEEEASFARTLNRGEALFSKYAAAAAEEKRSVLSGKDVWRLYDTYGFPVDLTQIMAEERGLKIDEVAFEKARLESLEASKAGGKTSAGAQVKLDVHDLAALEANSAVPKTDDSFKYRESAVFRVQTSREVAADVSRARRCQGDGQEHLPLVQVLQLDCRASPTCSLRCSP